MLVFFTGLAFNLALKACLSAPISSNSTTSVHWESEPDGRGTFRLLFSCVITSILCIWTSLHLNLPAQNETKSHRILRKLGWAAVAFLTPELTFYAAWCQRLSANAIVSEMNRLLDEKSTSDKEAPSSVDASKQENRWTLTHGYYASMGGFVIEIDPTAEEPFLPDMIDRQSPLHLTVTARGVLLLAKCGHIPFIPKESIVDKSNPDSLAKALVYFQAMGTIVQILARLAARLPVTLLEVNTLGFVLCALIIHLSWWHKPKDILAPTVLSGRWLPPIAAYMWMSSTISGHAPASKPWKPELRSLSYQPMDLSPPVQISAPRSVTRLEENRTLPNTGFTLNRRAMYEDPPLYVDLQPVDVKRWELASDALNQNPPIRSNLAQFTQIVRSAGDELLVKRTPNWPSWDLLLESEGHSFTFIPPMLGCLIGGVLYGALHAAAWNAYFPTLIERSMWRSASIIITGSCFGIILLGLVLLLVSVWYRNSDSLAHVLLVLSFIPIVLCIFSKAFLVVEALVSLRELPPTAYETPGWTQFIPHF